jgi:hypothetical protein
VFLGGVGVPALFVDIDAAAGAFYDMDTGFFFTDGAIHRFLLRFMFQM